jgi:hypothetical protein
VKAINPENKVRELQRKLYAAAKCNGSRRFHALYDRIFRGDVLGEAWKRVRANRGAAGIDGETLAAIEAEGVGRFLEDIQESSRAGRYRPSPVRRTYRPKSTTSASSSCSARSDTPEVRMQREKTIGQPCAGKPHARLDRGPQETEPAGHRA